MDDKHEKTIQPHSIKPKGQMKTTLTLHLSPIKTTRIQKFDNSMLAKMHLTN